jgi:transcriptional regulator with XRE-family HTH domain
MLNIRIKQLRLEKKLTQKELGDIIGVAHNAIANYEIGGRSPDYSILSKLADYFECTVDYLLGRTDKKNHVILEGSALPKELQGIVDKIGIAKNTGLTEKDIEEIIDLHVKMKKKS